MMTPQEVANCTFAKAVMGGYNMASVDDFLDKLTEDYTALFKENAALKAKMKVLADRVAEYREVEDAMRSTLLTAQKMATSMVAEAEAKRDELIADAAGAAKRRLEEIQQEVAAEEQRLVQVHSDVDAQIAVEQQRLATAQDELRTFIQSVQSVCNEQLSLLQRLPELPAVPVSAPAPTPDAPQEPQEEAGGEACVDMAAEVTPEDLEKNIQDVIAAFSQDGGAEEDDPFADTASLDDMDTEATRVLNLDDLQFGRNYTRE